MNKATNTDEKVILTPGQAIAMLPEKDMVHTFRQGGPVLIGADWDYPDLLESLKASPNIQLAGPMARAVGHNLAFHDGISWVFVETRKEPEE